MHVWPLQVSSQQYNPGSAQKCWFFINWTLRSCRSSHLGIQNKSFMLPSRKIVLLLFFSPFSNMNIFVISALITDISKTEVKAGVWIWRVTSGSLGEQIGKQSGIFQPLLNHCKPPMQQSILIHRSSLTLFEGFRKHNTGVLYSPRL